MRPSYVLMSAALVATAYALKDFVSVSNGAFELNNAAFKFGGTNNLWLQLLDAFTIDDAINRSAANNGTVMRIWGFNDGLSCPTPGPEQPYYQCFDNTTQQVWINETALATHLDYLVFRAKTAGVKLVMTLTNNWNNYGGIDSYLYWRSRLPGSPVQQYHGDFYTDPLIRGFYRTWVSTILNRVNELTGTMYKDEPAIMSWELGNELGCGGGGPVGPDCVVNGTSATMAAWIDEMATYIKSIDMKHLVSIGDEGFYGANNTGGCPCPRDQYFCSGSSGDWLRFLAIPAVDYGTLHFYPDAFFMSEWSLGPQMQVAHDWLFNHTTQAHALGKPLVMEEFGYTTNNGTGVIITQHEAYANFTVWADEAGVDGWNVWMWAGLLDNQNGVGPPEKPQWPAFWGKQGGLQVYCVAEGDPAPPTDTVHDILSCPVLSKAGGARRI